MIYAGETIRIQTSVLDLGGTDYLPVGGGTSATLELFDDAGTPIQILDVNEDPIPQPVEMVPDGSVEPNIWYYDWTSRGVPGGTYIAKVTITGTGFTVWNYKKITLREAPFNGNSNC